MNDSRQRISLVRAQVVGKGDLQHLVLALRRRPPSIDGDMARLDRLSPSIYGWVADTNPYYDFIAREPGDIYLHVTNGTGAPVEVTVFATSRRLVEYVMPVEVLVVLR